MTGIANLDGASDRAAAEFMEKVLFYKEEEVGEERKETESRGAELI